MVMIDIHSAQSILTASPQVPYVIISISDKPESLPDIQQNEHCKGLLQLCFHDVDKDFRRFKTISDEQAQEAVDFIQSHIGIDLIICQCDAGISRSSGMAAAIAKAFNGDDEQFFRRYMPNTAVYRKVLVKLQEITMSGCKHNWIVYSTAVVDATILVECSKCKERGGVLRKDFTEQDWKDAFTAPSDPYPLREDLYPFVQT